MCFTENSDINNSCLLGHVRSLYGPTLVHSTAGLVDVREPQRRARGVHPMRNVYTLAQHYKLFFVVWRIQPEQIRH